MTCGTLPALLLLALAAILRLGPLPDGLYPADDGFVDSLLVGERSLCLGLLMSERCGSGASSILPLKLASEESSGVVSGVVPASSGRVSLVGLSEYGATSFWPIEGDRGESGDLPWVVNRELLSELTNEPRLRAALNLPVLAVLPLGGGFSEVTS